MKNYYERGNLKNFGQEQRNKLELDEYQQRQPFLFFDAEFPHSDTGFPRSKS